MRVFGTVKDAATGMPLPDVKIMLYIREKELAVLHSDSEGKFEHKETTQYIGEILKWKVEKDGYVPLEDLHELEEDELTLKIKLNLKAEEEMKLTLNLKDENRNPLEGVKITLELKGEEVGVGLSDKYGIFKISLSPDLEEKTINYKAELKDFKSVEGEIPLKKETTSKITMLPSDRKWLKIAAGIGVVIFAAIIIWTIIPPPSPPIIHYFDAEPSTIIKGDSSTLKWATTNANSVKIVPIGNVTVEGSIKVSPAKTTIYVLTATNDAGSVDGFVKVIVLHGPTPTAVTTEPLKRPKIEYFKASPGEIKPGESTILSWNVTGAKRVTIDHEIGTVPTSDKTQEYPPETTTYTLTATNEAGSVNAKAQVVVVP